MFKRPIGQPLQPGDVIWVLPPLPLGGENGGSQVLASVLSIVVSIAAPWATDALFGQAFASTLGGRLVTAGIAIAVTGLISSLVPQPPQPAQLADPEPTYSFGGIGNRRRPGAAIPRPLGTMHRVPDLLAAPWAEFENNEQLAHFLLCIGLGEHEVLEFGVGDTAVWTAEAGYTDAVEDISHEVLLPGETPTLFPTAIEVSPEVEGLELPEPDATEGEITVGPIAAVQSGRRATELVFDFTFPRGLFENNNGEAETTVTWRIEAMLIDDLGQAAGFRQELGTESFTAATTTPQRLTKRYDVPAGRYQVWATRTSASTLSGAGAQDQLIWAGLKAKRNDLDSYARVTTLAIRVRANATSQTGLGNWYVKSRAILPHFDLATGGIVTGPTEQIDAGVLLIARARYGLDLQDERIDLDQLYSLAKVWHARGDVCCTALEGEMTAWEALTTVLGAGRDGPRPRPSKVITQADMVRGSFSIERLYKLEHAPSAVQFVYRDRQGRMCSMMVPPDADPNEAVEICSSVHVDPEHAWRDANFREAENQLRRRFVSWVGLSAAKTLLKGELVEVSHPRPDYGAGGNLIALNGLGLELAFDHGLAAAETGWLSLAEPDGGYWGPVRCYGIDARSVQLDPADLDLIRTGGSIGNYDPDFRKWLVTDDAGRMGQGGTSHLDGCQAVPTRAAVGRDGHRTLWVLIADVSPAEAGQVDVLGVEYAAAVHEAETAPMPPQTDIAPALLNDDRPAWEGVQISGPVDVFATPPTASMTVTGPAIPAAVRYLVEVTATDEEGNWLPAADSVVPNNLPIGDHADGVFIRVAAAGPILRGPWQVFVLNFANASGGVTVAEFVRQEA